MQTFNAYPKCPQVTYLLSSTSQESGHLGLYKLEQLKDITNDKAEASGWVCLRYVFCGEFVIYLTKLSNSSVILYQMTELINNKFEKM
jgi:hypothetical protein